MNRHRNLTLIFGLGLAVVIFTSGFFTIRTPRSSGNKLSAFVLAKGAARGRRAVQSLTLEDRVAYQRAIEEVYWRHRIWPKENPQPKPPLDEVMPESVIRAKVEDSLRQSQALEVYWQRPITAEQLQAEMERMARQTKEPEVLRELWAALGNDPLVIAECLARPVLTERLIRHWYASDERFHGELKRQAEAELSWPGAVERMREMTGEYREVEWHLADSESENPQSAIRSSQSDGVRVLDQEQWRKQMNKLAQMLGANAINLQSAIQNRQLSGLQEDEDWFYAVSVLEKAPNRVKVATIAWPKRSFSAWWSDVKKQHERTPQLGEGGSSISHQNNDSSTTELFTFTYQMPEIIATGCTDDTWGDYNDVSAPLARLHHQAVWTGSEMIVWGGASSTISSILTRGQAVVTTQPLTPGDQQAQRTRPRCESRLQRYGLARR